MVLVTETNFLKESNNLIQKFPTAAFISLDLELTGIQIPTVPRPSKFDQPFERYAQLKLCPERYSIVQIGICVFEENPEFRKYAKRVTTVTRSHLGDDNVGVDNVNDNDNGGDMNIDNDKTNDNNQEDQEAQRLLHAMPLEATQHDKNDNSSDEEGISSSSSFNSDNENDDDHVSNNSNSDSDSDQAHQHGRGHGRGRNVHYINDRGRDVGHDNDHDNAHDIDNAHDNDGNNHRRNRPRSLRNEPPEFLIHKYNFLIFPSSDSTREVVMNPKSIQHLNHSSRQGMFLSHHSDFNWEEWIKHGIPYLSLDIAQEELMKFQKEHNRDAFDQNGNSKSNANANVNENGTNNLQEGETHAHAQVPHCSSEEVAQEWEEPSDPADVAFIARAMANLREWIDSAAGNRGGLDENGQLLSLSDNLTLAQEQRLGIVKILPQTKKESLKKCLRRKIENEYPALHWDMNDNHEVLVRLNDDEKRIRDARRKKFAWQKMHEEKIGFTRVFKALSDACRGELGNTGDLDEEYRSFLDEANRNIGANDIGNDTNDEWVIPKVGDGDGDTDEVAFHNTTNPDKDSKQEEWVCGSLLTNQSKDKRRKVPIIVHNGFLDLLFLMTHFQRHKLPPTYEEGKNLARHYFPLIYDTKVLATELSDFSIRSRSSSLVDLHQRYVRGDGVGDIDGFVELHLDVIPRSIIVNSGHVHRDDAVMIGTVFQCLCRRIKWGSDSYNGLDNDDKRRKLFKAVATAKKSRVGSLLFLNESLPESKLSAPLYGLNKVFLSQSIFTVDMEALHDHLKPGYTTSAIFKVSHPNKLISLNEINTIIKGIKDQGNSGRNTQKIHYEIGLTSKWFIVAARSKIPRGVDENDPVIIADIAATLDRRGGLLKTALHNNFLDCRIQSLEETMVSSTGTWSGSKRKKKRRRPSDDMDETEADDGEKKGIFAKLLGSLGLGQRDNETPSHKRARLFP